MEVSHFELIFKPQAPAAVSGVQVDRVIQGYFLEITNLEDKEYRYKLEFVAVPPPLGTFNREFRSLARNTLVFVDTPGVDNQPGTLLGSSSSPYFHPSTGYIRVPPLATALVAVLPSVFGPTPVDMTPIAEPVFEVRGFVRISLPALRIRSPFISTAQSKGPVKVLLTPQNRATFLGADNTIKGQVQATLPTATGAAAYSIPPSPGFVGFKFPLNPLKVRAQIVESLLQDPGLVSSEALSEAFGQLKPKRADLEVFQKVLAEAVTEVALPPRR